MFIDTFSIGWYLPVEQVLGGRGLTPLLLGIFFFQHFFFPTKILFLFFLFGRVYPLLVARGLKVLNRNVPPEYSQYEGAFVWPPG